MKMPAARLALAVLGSAFAVPQATAALTATALFADFAVLQTSDEAGAGARLTGTASPGEVVTLKGLPPTAAPAVPTATASASGEWSLAFNASSTDASAPLTLTLSGSKPGETIVARSVLIGDVRPH